VHNYCWFRVLGSVGLPGGSLPATFRRSHKAQVEGIHRKFTFKASRVGSSTVVRDERESKQPENAAETISCRERNYASKLHGLRIL